MPRSISLSKRSQREPCAACLSPTAKDNRVGDRAAASNVEIACTQSNSSWLNRIEAQFTALQYFALDGTDHASHQEQASMIRRYIIWRNNHAYDERLRLIVGFPS